MISVIFPALNEAAVIRPTLVALATAMQGRGEPYRAILVDDGSTDATVSEAEAAVTDSGGALTLVVCSHATNRGLGAALRTGIYRALEDGAPDDVVVTLDADGTHPPDLIPTMLERIRSGNDVVIASRYEEGATVVGVPGYRLFLSAGARWLLRVLFPMKGVRDYTCGFRAIRVAALRRAQVVYGDDLCTARGFEATLDLLLCLRTVGIRATEVPLQLDYSPRVGKSKMRVMRTIRRTLAVIGRRFVDRFTRYRAKEVRARLTSAGLGSSR